MEEKKEFEIINHESYDKCLKINKISKYACIPCIASLIVVTACLSKMFNIYLSIDMLDEYPLQKTFVKALDIIVKASCALGSLSILDAIKKGNDAVKELECCYENAEDKDNIEVPSDVRKKLKKMLGI